MAILLGVCASALVPAPAGAQDSNAPPGAGSGWVPREEWVLRHWIPFDEQALKARLGLHGRDLEAFLYNDHRTLAMIATQRGITPQALADELVAPWAGRTDAARLALLRDHALQIVTQGHLAQHIFFHVFHGIRARMSTRRLFGLSSRRYSSLRQRGLTPLEVANVGGVSRAQVVAGMTRIFRRDRNDGVALRFSLPAAADLVLHRQLRALPCWLRRPLPAYDPSNPYGRESRHHPVAKPQSERTDAEERRDDVRVEQVRRHLPPSCWQPPAPWSWSAHGLDSPWGGTG